jgi:glucose/arabinose dehydrogenase
MHNRRNFRSRVLPMAVLAALAASQFAFAQQPASPAPASSQQPANPDQKSDDSQQPTETLKVNVNVVQLFFNVKDKHGALIPNMT